MSPFAVEYWLRHCEGFGVEAPEGRVGFVEEIETSAETESPVALLVRGGAHGRIRIPVDEIDEIALEGERIVLHRLRRFAPYGVRPVPRRRPRWEIEEGQVACSQCGRPVPAGPDLDEDAAALLLCPDCRRELEEHEFEEGGGD